MYCGANFSNTINIDKLETALYEYCNIEFLPFSKPEAVLLVKISKSISDEEALPLLKQLKPYAGYNPYLLTHALKRPTLNDSYATCYWATVRYMQRTLPMEDSMLFLNHVEEIAEYLHFAQQNVQVDAQRYKTSFVHLHMLTYIVNHNKSCHGSELPKAERPLSPFVTRAR